MDIHELFHSQADRMAAFSQMQQHLYCHDTALQDYFLPLQSGVVANPRAHSRDQSASRRLIELAIRGADKVSQFRPGRMIKADVLFCPMPYFGRQTENRFLVRTLLGLAQTDAKILCLLPSGAPCRDELVAELASAGRSGQVSFIDPAASFSRMEGRLQSMAGRIRGRTAFAETVQILEPHGLSPSPEARGGFEHAAYFVEAWERLAPFVEFDAVVARCHWQTLCSPVCRTARQRGKPVITFQQGVIGHTLDVPVTASKYVSFGQPSAAFLARACHR